MSIVTFTVTRLFNSRYCFPAGQPVLNEGKSPTRTDSYDVTVSTSVNLCDPVLETRLSGRLHLYYFAMCLVGLRWLRPVTLCDIFDGWKWEANSRQESNPRVPLPCTELYGQPPALTILCTGGFTHTSISHLPFHVPQKSIQSEISPFRENPVHVELCFDYFNLATAVNNEADIKHVLASPRCFVEHLKFKDVFI